MELSDIKTIAVIGGGTMGHGIGLSYARYGYRVVINDLNEAVLDNALNHVRQALETFAREGLIPPAEIATTLANITTTTDLAAAVAEADFITEAVAENIELKQDLFRRIEDSCPERAILASNTSALLLEDITVKCRRPEQTIITHWVNPPHLVPLVEVVGSAKTAPATFELAEALLERINKSPVRVKKAVPGFIVNRLQAALLREAWALWQQGIVSAADIDRVIKAGLGFRWAATGPMETADLGGLDIFYRVMSGLFPDINDGHEPPVELKEMVDAGNLGLKSGQGFFEYDVNYFDEEAAASVVERDRKHIQLLKLWYS